MEKYPDPRWRVKGEYENKIRRGSPPEKVFEVFASQRNGEELVMSHYDLFRALCPYNYTTKSNEELNEQFKDFKSKTLAEFADLDGDGTISLYEFYYVSMLLQGFSFSSFTKSPRDILRVVTPREEQSFFQTKGNSISQDDFKQLLVLHEKKQSLTTSGLLPDPRRMRVNPEKQEKFLSSMAKKFFGAKESISFNEYDLFKRDLKRELHEFEVSSVPT